MSKHEQLIALIEEEVKRSLNEQAAEAPADAPFGKYLWAEPSDEPESLGRNGIRRDKAKEPNTEAENLFLDAYLSLVVDNSGDRFAKFAKSVLDPLKQSGLYNKYVQPPKGPLYRGMKVTPRVAAKLLRLPYSEFMVETNRAWYVEGGGVVPVKGGKAMSWSTDPEVAFNFAVDSQWGDDHGVAILFVASPDDGGNFYLNPTELLNKFDLGRLSSLIPEEKEVVSIGPVPFREAAFLSFEPDKSNVFDDYAYTNKYVKKTFRILKQQLESRATNHKKFQSENFVNKVVKSLADDLVKRAIDEHPIYQQIRPVDVKSIKNIAVDELSAVLSNELIDWGHRGYGEVSVFVDENEGKIQEAVHETLSEMAERILELASDDSNYRKSNFLEALGVAIRNKKKK